MDEATRVQRKAQRDLLRTYNLRSFMDRRRTDERVALLTVLGQVIEIENKHPEPDERWAIYPDQVQENTPPGDAVWAILHTHPFRSSRAPSIHDLEKLPTGMLGVVLHVASGTLTLYRQNRVILSTRTPPTLA